MRLKPSLLTAVVLTVVYSVVVLGLAAVLQPDGASFETAFDDLDNSRYLAYALAAGVAFGAIVATIGGWWKPILANDRTEVGPVTGWLRFVPIVLFVVVAATTDWGALPDFDTDLLIWIAAASIAVGISEELMFRGNIIACLRRAPMPEFQVWLWSSILFGLIHLGNVGIGAGVGGSIGNTVVAFFGGGMFYIVRRVSGSIIVAMALHAAWDFTTFAAENGNLAFFRLLVMIPIVIVAVTASRDRLFPVADEPDPVPAET